MNIDIPSLDECSCMFLVGFETMLVPNWVSVQGETQMKTAAKNTMGEGVAKDSRD